MTSLDSRKRAQLPDSAFAYIDPDGRRRLPINDEAHVRNALARFNQVPFEDEAARDRARTKVLRAAKKYGIVPVGFISGQLRAPRGADLRALPSGMVTLLLTDIEASTELIRRLDDRYGPLLSDVRRLIRTAVRRADGREVDARADEFFAAFARAPSALDAAVAIQRAIAKRPWPDGVEVRLRIGIHRGRPTLTESGYVGLSVHTAARVASAAHGGQIVLSAAARDAIDGAVPTGIGFRDLGRHRLHGLPEPEALFQVEAADLHSDFPPPRVFSPSVATEGVR